MLRKWIFCLTFASQMDNFINNGHLTMQKNTVLSRRLSTDRIPGIPTINQLANATGVASQLLSAFLTFGHQKQISLRFASLRGAEHASTGIYRLRKHLQAYLLENRGHLLRHIPWLAGFFAARTDSSETYTELSVLLSSLKVKKTEGQIFLTASNRNKQSFDIKLLDTESGSLDLFIQEQPSLESTLDDSKESEAYFLKEDLLNSINQIKKEYDKQIALSTLLAPKYDHLLHLITNHIAAFQVTQELTALIETFTLPCKDFLTKHISFEDIQND